MARRKLAGLNGDQIVEALQRVGFEVIRIRGSHRILRKRDMSKLRVTVPVHGTKDLPPGTVRSIVKQAGLTIEEFSKLL